MSLPIGTGKFLQKHILFAWKEAFIFHFQPKNDGLFYLSMMTSFIYLERRINMVSKTGGTKRDYSTQFVLRLCKACKVRFLCLFSCAFQWGSDRVLFWPSQAIVKWTMFFIWEIFVNARQDAFRVSEMPKFKKEKKAGYVFESYNAVFCLGWSKKKVFFIDKYI